MSALAFNGNTTLLASAQTGNHSVVRVWNYHKGNCLAMFKVHAHSLSSLRYATAHALMYTIILQGHRSLCLYTCMLLTHTHFPLFLFISSFSYSGGTLCGVGKDNHNKTVSAMNANFPTWKFHGLFSNLCIKAISTSCTLYHYFDLLIQL